MSLVRYSRGFSLLEVLIVFVLLTVVAGFLVSGFQDFARFQEYNQAVSDVSFQLQQAHTNARSAVGDSAHGLYFDTNSITVFSGETYDPVEPSNVVLTYTNVTFTPVLSDTGTTVVFEKLTGVAQATGTISVVGVRHAAATAVRIGKTGIIE